MVDTVAQDDAKQKRVARLCRKVPALHGPAEPGPPLAAETPRPVEALHFVAGSLMPAGKDGFALQLNPDRGAWTETT